ncbi:MAG: TVP38/TMEM64 family protein, partial [Gammaproteobacteria bacterium]
MTKARIALICLIAAAITSYFLFDLDRFLTLEYVQSRLGVIQQFKEENFALTSLIYFLVYVAAAGLSIPGAILLTLLGGAIFGLLWGTILVSFASSIGATLAFLASRVILRDWVQQRFGDYLGPVNRGIEKDGNFYLFSIRLVPVIPYFMVNLLMGLTPIGTGAFYIVSQVGMLPATAVYVNAGAALARIDNLAGLVSGQVILAFVLLGIFTLLARAALNWIKRNKIMGPFSRPKKFDVNTVVIGAGS